MSLNQDIAAFKQDVVTRISSKVAFKSIKKGDVSQSFDDLADLIQLSYDLSIPDGVKSGLSLSTNNNILTVQPGIWKIGSDLFSTSAPTVFELEINDPDLFRYDLVYGDNAGNLGVVTGEFSENPVEPELPANSIRVATVFITPDGYAPEQPDLSSYVDRFTAQSIDGIKTFIKSPIIPNAVNNNQAVNLGQLNAVIPPGGIADDANVVHKTGNETIIGYKTFTANIAIGDLASTGAVIGSSEFYFNIGGVRQTTYSSAGIFNNAQNRPWLTFGDPLVFGVQSYFSFRSNYQNVSGGVEVFWLGAPADDQYNWLKYRTQIGGTKNVGNMGANEILRVEGNAVVTLAPTELNHVVRLGDLSSYINDGTNGLHKDGNSIKLGGSLTEFTQITPGNNVLLIGNDDSTLVTGQGFIQLQRVFNGDVYNIRMAEGLIVGVADQVTGIDTNFIFTKTGTVFIDNRNSEGIIYGGDFSVKGLQTDRWVPDLGAVKGLISTATSPTLVEYVANKNQANGYAGLNSSGLLPLSLFPDKLLGNVKYKGTYNGVTDVITSADTTLNGLPLPASTDAITGYYFMNTANFILAGKDYKIGDWIISNGTAGGWDKVDNSDAVMTVFGRLGNIVANTGDYTAAQVTNAVDSTGSYTNPTWVVSLPWSKITSPPNTVAGYGITDVYTKTQSDVNYINNALSFSTPQFGNYSITGMASIADGSILAPVSTNTKFLVLRTTDATDNNNEHTFADNSIFIKNTGGFSIASYDTRLQINGTTATNHAIGFQSALVYNNTNTISNFYGLADLNTVTAGTVTNMWNLFAQPTIGGGTIAKRVGVQVSDFVKTGGTVTLNIGLNISDLTSATTNWSILTGVAPSRFGGDVIMSNLSGAANSGANIQFVSGTGYTPEALITHELISGTAGNLKFKVRTAATAGIAGLTEVLGVSGGASPVVTVTGALNVSSAFTTGLSTANIYVPNSSTATNLGSAAQYQFASSSNNYLRSGFYGGSTTALTTGSNYSAVIFANAPITTFTSGTHNWLANVVIKPIGTITPGGAGITNTAALYIDGASSAGTNNYVLYTASGLTNHVNTGEQLRLGYDLSNYNSLVTASDGSFSITSNGGNATRFLSLDMAGISTASGQLRLFRLTNTSGALGLTMYKGDGTSTAQTYFSANGGSYFNAAVGNLVVGSVTSTGGKLEITSSTEQLRLSYDSTATQYTSFTVSATGGLNITPFGTTPQILLNGITSVNELRSTAGVNNARIQLSTNGTTISRNQVSGLPVLVVSQLSASATGNILSLTNSGGEVANVSKDGILTAAQYKLSALNTAPATSTSTGILGDIRFTSDSIYLCIATNTWVKAILTTF